ncbi:FadR/GntR family transcriptional regulator [Azohydromonas caseinilytica]|uniref:FadR/GntR family transcriptional regulator n=1 Tax=Azohydromonas caseinilytica TaxID=2728836 RepID=UPI0028738A8B|nr:FadR/GntR family transcriptional regulator [Azohydromonas caseinilytica]
MPSATVADERLQDPEAGTLADQIHARMVEAILCGDFPRGSRLPTEWELASRFGVARSTVREALSRLRSDGIIETRRGSGSHVVGAPAAAGVTTPPIHSLADVERFYAFRSCVEAGAAAAAAECCCPEELGAIRAGLEALRQAMERGRPSAEADTQFHVAIARASHNPFFITTLTTVVPVRQFVDVFSTAIDKRTPGHLRTTHAEHEAVFNAIARRSPAEAEQAMRVHVLNTKVRLLESMRLP